MQDDACWVHAGMVSGCGGGAAQVSEQARELLNSHAAVSFETAKFMLDLNKVRGPSQASREVAPRF